MSTQRESRRSVNPILHIWASKLSFFILLLKLKWVGFISHFRVLYFRNVDLDLPKISELFWTPVLSRCGDENLTPWKNHLVYLWPKSFIRANYVQLPQQNFSRTPLFLPLTFCFLFFYFSIILVFHFFFGVFFFFLMKKTKKIIIKKEKAKTEEWRTKNEKNEKPKT